MGCGTTKRKAPVSAPQTRGAAESQGQAKAGPQDQPGSTGQPGGVSYFSHHKCREVEVAQCVNLEAAENAPEGSAQPQPEIAQAAQEDPDADINAEGRVVPEGPDAKNSGRIENGGGKTKSSVQAAAATAQRKNNAVSGGPTAGAKKAGLVTEGADGGMIMAGGTGEGNAEEENKEEPGNPMTESHLEFLASKLDKEIFEYQNIARQHPEYIVAKLKKLLEKPSPSEYTADALKEAIHEMSVKKPAPTLQWDEGMFRACRDHVLDLGPKGKLDHKGTDGKTVFERINRYGKYHGICGENMQTGKRDAKEVVLSLIIDPGNSKKVHRRTLMEAKFVKAAVCSGEHSKYGIWTVLAYTGE